MHEKIKHFYHGLYIYVHILHISFNISIIHKTKTFTSGGMYKFLKVIWPSGNFPQIITLYLHGYFFKGGSGRYFKKQTLIPRGLRTGGTGPPRIRDLFSTNLKNRRFLLFYSVLYKLSKYGIKLECTSSVVK